MWVQFVLQFYESTTHWQLALQDPRRRLPREEHVSEFNFARRAIGRLFRLSEGHLVCSTFSKGERGR